MTETPVAKSSLGPVLAEQPKPGDCYRHLKNGQRYKVVGHARIERDWVPSVVYEREDGSSGWIVRPITEFMDGRFELVEDGQQ